MKKSKIKWCDYTINPVKGLCPMACPYCYARRMYKRFKWNPEIRWEPEHLLDLNLMPDGSKVFIGSTIELFGDWIKEKWLQDLFYWWIPRYPNLTFIFLTKQPQNLIKWSPFPDNVWILASVTNQKQYDHAMNYLGEIDASVIGLSIEPLLGRIVMGRDMGQDWYILGQQTPPSKKTTPKIEWIQEILVASHNAHVPIFMKDNLQPLVDKSVGWEGWKLLQEFPK